MEDWSKQSEELQSLYRARLVASVERMGELRQKMEGEIKNQIMFDAELAKRMIYYHLSRGEGMSSLGILRQHLEEMKAWPPITIEANAQHQFAKFYCSEIDVILTELSKAK